MALVLVEVDGPVGTLTIDCPAKRNALGEALIGALIAGLEQLRARSVRVAILRAKPGVKVWSAGYAIDEIPDSARDALGWSAPLRQLVRSLQEFPVPLIALIEGGVWGGACEVVFACDIVNATPDVTFAITPARLGVPYNVTGLQNLVAVMPLALVKEMAFTARPIGVERAWHLGAVNHVVPTDRIGSFTADMARTIAGNAPLTVAAIKESLRILADATVLLPAQYERLSELRNRTAGSRDYHEGLAAFAEKRPPVFRGE
ncbi:MAG: methylmalonyl-CoA decarboxylase [Rhodospirillaceae bacterium]